MPDNLPGIRSRVDSVEVEVLAQGHRGMTMGADQRVTLDSTTVDSGNTPTTTLRGGLIVGKKDSDGNGYAYDPDGADGSQGAVGVLPKSVDMLLDGTATDRFTKMLTQGILKTGELINLDQQALAQLVRRGFTVADDDPPGAAYLVHPKLVQTKTTDYTVVAADNGKLFVATGAANFTLPTIAAGLSFEFLQASDNNLVITAAANTIIYDDTGGGLSTTLTFSTANQKMGARVRVLAIYTATSTLAWSVEILTGHTVTAA